MTVTATPEQGQLVHVRSRRWVVNDIKPSSLPTSAMKSPVHMSQHLLTLSSVEDDGLGEELQVVWEVEPGAAVIEKVSLPEPTGFDPPERLDAFLDAVRNPKHEEHENMLEWIGGRFEPDEFDAKQATKEMKKGLPDWRE